jgi:cytochrome b6-f complex iron-sulfur subunit
MERAEFLSKLGIGVAVACTGCSLVACGSKGDNPMPSQGNPPPMGSGVLFTADLNSELMNIGNSKIQQGVIIVRVASGNVPDSFAAVQVACTHQGNTINYNTGQGIFICPAHGSEFSKTGQVLMGPATTPLNAYTVIIDSNILTVTA